MPVNLIRPEVLVFGASSGNPLAPHPKTGGFHLASHQSDYLAFRQSKLLLNCFEWRPVFPGHLNDAVYFLRCHGFGNNCRLVMFGSGAMCHALVNILAVGALLSGRWRFR